MTKPSPKQSTSEGSPDGQLMHQMTSPGMPRRVSVKACQGEDAKVVVTVVRGTVWLSISPPFTWEAIMEPGKVDELMHVLELAREEAKRIAAAHGGAQLMGVEVPGRAG